MRVSPSSKSSRSRATTFSRIGASESRVSRTATCLPFAIDNRVCQRLELFAVQLSVEARPGSPSVVQGNLARAFERTGCGNAHECPSLRQRERVAGERGEDDLVLLRRKEQRQCRRAVAQVGPGDLAGLDRRAGAVEDVVGDLERDAEGDAVLTRPAAEPAGGLEE